MYSESGNQPKYQKVSVADLTPSMWICRFDQDLEQQPFETRGFYFSSVENLLALAPECRFVYVDTSRKASRKLYLNVNRQMEQVFNDLRLGRALNLPLVRTSLHELMTEVLHDSKSMVYLAMLREHQDVLVTKSVSVAVLSLAFAKYLGVKQADLSPLGMGALLHPLGLLSVPNSILNKVAPLTSAEKKLVRQYPQAGYNLLVQQQNLLHQNAPNQDTSENNTILQIVLQHQERVNGTGYPHQLTGRSINFLARLVAITSVYEALTRDRSDRPAISPTKALSQLYRWRFEDFDSRLVEKFIQSLGVYPPGCLVELDDGSLAVVYATHPNQRLHPKVRLLTDANLQPLEFQEPLDLSTTSNKTIVKALNPEEPRFAQLIKKLSRQA